VPACYMW